MPITLNDLYMRLKRNLVSWFGTDTPVLNSLLMGIATNDYFIYQLIQYANEQTRISTATGIYLDYISQDFYGDALPRRAGESDNAFRTRILANLVPIRCTRQGLYEILLKLTGFAPVMIEGFATTDCGAYDVSLYNDAGFGIGAPSLAPYFGIIYAFIPAQTGLLNYYGYDYNPSIDNNQAVVFGYDLYGTGTLGHYWSLNAYVDESQNVSVVTAEDVYETVQANKVYGTYIQLYVNGILFINYRSN